MVRKEQNLGLLREFVQDLEACCSAFVIEVDEKIVCDERHRLGMIEVVFDGSDPEREIKLVCGTVAHAGDGHAPSISADTRANIVGPSCSATSNSACIAACLP
jgi:hypothetical protein